MYSLIWFVATVGGMISGIFLKDDSIISAISVMMLSAALCLALTR